MGPAVVLIEKLVFNVAYEKIGVAGSHFGAHAHAIDLFQETMISCLFIITTSERKTALVLKLVQPGGAVFPSLVF